jgi:hypothetical protein
MAGMQIHCYPYLGLYRLRPHHHQRQVTVGGRAGNYIKPAGILKLFESVDNIPIVNITKNVPGSPEAASAKTGMPFGYSRLAELFLIKSWRSNFSSAPLRQSSLATTTELNFFYHKISQNFSRSYLNMMSQMNLI